MSSGRTILKLPREKVLFTLIMAFFVLLVAQGARSNNYFIFGLPLFFIFVSIALNHLKQFWYIMVFCVPLSLTLPKFFGGSGLTFPTDLMALMIMGILVFKMVSERRISFKFYQHPITMMIGLYLLWQIFAAVDSTMPMVSWKWIAAYLWMLVSFFFLPALLFRDQKTIFRFFQLIFIGFILAMSIIIFLYVSTGRNPFGLRFNPGPFFVDHTVFGAFTAMWIPVLALLIFRAESTKREKQLYIVALVFFLMGLFFSYSRGAWGSMILAMVLMLVYQGRRWVKRLIIPFMLFIVVASGYVYYVGMEGSRVKNDAVSRKSFADHIASVTNFRTDYSNAERINRWYCAWNMFEDEPWTGFGPGTYAFVYGDYQTAKNRTPVSTNHGDNGTAHNEFLLALSESGWPSGVLLLLLFIIPVWRGLQGYTRARGRNVRMLYMGVTFALICYDVHALVNNFLDQDKVGGTYYAMLAIIVALDTYVLPEEARQREIAGEAENS